MKSTVYRPAIMSVVIVCLWCSSLVSTEPHCPADISKRIGREVGKAFLAQASMLGNHHVRSVECDIECDEEDNSRLMRSVCASEIRIVDSLAKADEHGCMSDNVPYEMSYGYYVYRMLGHGLTSRNALTRWNVLERIVWLCEGGDVLSESANTMCRSEIESACLDVLSHDDDRSNREHALEILRRGYASARSRQMLNVMLDSVTEPNEHSIVIEILSKLPSED